MTIHLCINHWGLQQAVSIGEGGCKLDADANSGTVTSIVPLCVPVGWYRYLVPGTYHTTYLVKCTEDHLPGR